MADANTPYAFLSYSRRDQAFAARLAQDLRVRGIQLWFDQVDIPLGVNWDDAIHRALHGARAVLLVVSESSVLSPNVLNELTVALDNGKWIIPVMLANVQVPLRIARLQRVDFATNYAAGLRQLANYMMGGASRTSALEAIASSTPAPVTAVPSTPPPPPHTGPSTYEYRTNSLGPIDHPIPAPRQRGSWMGAVFVGAGLATVILIGGLFVLVAVAPKPSPEPDVPKGPSSAGKAPNTKSLAAIAPNEQPLGGTWLGECGPFDETESIQATITFKGSVYTSDTVFYDSTNCTRPTHVVRLVADITSIVLRSTDIYETDYRIRGISAIPVVAAHMNRQGRYGFRAWRDGVPRALDDATVAQLFPVPFTPGMVTYDLTSVQGDTLYEGRTRRNRSPTTPADRPRSLDTTVKYIRQSNRREPPAP